MPREIEIKLAIDSLAGIRRRLRGPGFRIVERRVREVNSVFDAAGLPLRAANKLLRVRRAGRVHTLTFKGPATVGRHKSREELETTLGDAGVLERILPELGYTAVFRYEKWRTTYARPGEAGKVFLDETPVGNFLELEGPPRWIDLTARALGFSAADYITGSYGSLYLEWCARRGVKPKDMLFA